MNDEEFYNVLINSTTQKVVNCVSEVTPIGGDEIQKLVDKLIKKEMITLDESIVNKDGNVEVGINIWDIGEDDLYIETYHRNPNIPINELFDDYDCTMKYEDFLECE